MKIADHLAGVPRVQIGRWWGQARSSWRIDLLAGLTLWGLAVPQGIAYAGLAGLGPAAGVWPVVICLLVYAIWGSSRRLIVTPLSSTAVLMASLMVALGDKSTPQRAAALLLAASAVLLLAYLLKLGFIVNFISDPINAGFMFGLSIVITVGQLGKLIGVNTGSGSTLAQLIAFIRQIPHANWVTAAISALAFAIMLGFRRWAPSAPRGLIMIVITTAIVALGHLNQRFHVATPAAVATGLPHLVVPDFAGMSAINLAAAGVGLTLLALSETGANGRELATGRGGHYRLNTDLFPLGLGNALTALVGGIMSAGSTSTTAANVASGAKTPLSGITAALAAAITVLFFGNLLSALPMATLAVLIIVSVSGRINLRFVTRIRDYSAAEAIIAIVAALGVLAFGVLNGLVIAIVASLVWFIGRTTSLSHALIGPSSRYGVMVHPETPTYEPLPDGVTGVRFTGQIFYGNVLDVIDTFDELLRGTGSAEHPENHALIVDLSGQEFFDYTTREAFGAYAERNGDHGPIVVAVGVRDAVAQEFAAIEATGGLPERLVLRRSTDVRPILDELAAGRVPPSDAVAT